MKFINTLMIGVGALLMSVSCHPAEPSSQTAGETAIVEQTPFGKHGALRVEGSNVVDQNGQVTQLRGISMGWHSEWWRFYNESTVKTLKSWGAEITRCPIGLEWGKRPFGQDPELAYATVDTMVKACANQGLYLIIDFHAHANKLDTAKMFFETVCAKYKDYSNIIYEIWNEPTIVEWKECKEYAEAVIPVIRKHCPNALIIVPTPKWDQEVDKAADDPVQGFDNLLYNVHYYSAFHKDPYRQKAVYAIEKGLPLIFSETGGMMHTGDDELNLDEWEKWIGLAKQHNITWLAWSVSDKVETCSMLRHGAPSEGEKWQETDIKPWAVLVRYYLQNNF